MKSNNLYPEDKQIAVCFSNAQGHQISSHVYISLSATRGQLQQLINTLIEDEPVPFSFKIKGKNESFIEIENNIESVLTELGDITSESLLNIYYFPLIPFRVKPVTRCTSSLEGHSEAVLCVAFSPDSKFLATGSGDSTVRVWDILTETPIKTFKNHTSWVLSVEWSANTSHLASASMDKNIIVWRYNDIYSKGDPTGIILKGHTKGITCLAWQPLHLMKNNQQAPNLASGSLDCSIRIWDVANGTCLLTLTSHTLSITHICYCGSSNPLSLYSCSKDTYMKLWNVETGELLKNFKGHGHWINCLATNTQSIFSRSLIDPKTGEYQHLISLEEQIEYAKSTFSQYFNETCGGIERVITGSDDNSIILWEPSLSENIRSRLVGHQNSVNHVRFSPDCRFIASASFDKSIRLWDGLCGKYIGVLRGHVGAVYQLNWSPDGRSLVSCSADSTIKLWNIFKKKILQDLPGHADQVYAISWSCDGSAVASGSKDRFVKIWKY